MGMVESGLARPNWLRRVTQEHARVFFFSLGKMGRAPLATLLGALVIGIALALPAALHLVVGKLSAVGYSWQASLQISLFLKDGSPPEQGRQLRDTLAARDDVAAARYISKDESLDEFSTRAGFGEALAILNENPLPAVIVITPKPELPPEAVEALAAELGQFAEVELAKLDRKWLERLHAILALGERAVLIIAGLLGIAVVIIVGNTVRLEVESRREEIVVMKLLGAPPGFVRRPFLYTGAWQGLLGGLLAWLLVALGGAALAPPAARLAGAYGTTLPLAGLAPQEGLALVGIGLALGWLAAWLTVSRHLLGIEPG